jgi:neutral trehalase
MARNAADAVRSARPTGEYFSALQSPARAGFTVTNRTLRRPPVCEIIFIETSDFILVLKNFH